MERDRPPDRCTVRCPVEKMPLSQHRESAAFATLGSVQVVLCLVGIVAVFVGLDTAAFGIGLSLANVFIFLCSVAAHVLLVAVATRRPDNVDFDILLAMAGGFLLFFVQIAAVVSSDYIAFGSFVNNTCSLVVEQPLVCPHPCSWKNFTTLVETQASSMVSNHTHTGPIASVSMLAISVEMALIMLAAYQRCGDTASDDTNAE